MLESSFPRTLPDCVCTLSHLSPVRLFANPWSVARQAPLSMGFSKQEYWSGLPCPPPGDLPDPGIKPRSFMSPALAGRFFTTGATWEALPWLCYSVILFPCASLRDSNYFFLTPMPIHTQIHQANRPLKLKSIVRSWGKITKAGEGKDKELWK